VAQVELLDAPALTADKNDIHVKTQAVMKRRVPRLREPGFRLCRIRLWRTMQNKVIQDKEIKHALCQSLSLYLPLAK
jgi:hypothetical protein